MSEIKFACPHCGQHIACDSDYANLGIECPSCGGPVVVPRLSPGTSGHGGMVIVASSSLPSPRPTQRIPPLDIPNGPRWPGDLADISHKNPVATTVWVVGLFATFVLAFLFSGNISGLAAIAACIVIVGTIAGYLWARRANKSTARAVLSGVVLALVLLVMIPILMVGILFIGCTVCAR